jgi:hypothetical protein
VGVRLVLRLIDDDLVPPEWVLCLLVALLFLWGCSKREAQPEQRAATTAAGGESTTVPPAP